jgi:small subunit ribosomal protein S20
MPNIKSAIKRVRTAEQARLRNHAKKSAFRTSVKRALASTGSPEQPELLRNAISTIDRAAKVGAIHPRAAARYKSRLMRKVAAQTGQPVVLGSASAAQAKPKAKSAAKKAASKPDESPTVS